MFLRQRPASVVALVVLSIALAGASSAATESSGNKITTVTSGPVRSYLSSVAVGRDGLPVISYYGNGRLRVVHCGNRFCSRGNTFTTVDKQPGVGYSSSIVIGADGLPLISYGSNLLPAGSRVSHHLKVVHCGTRACSRRNAITTVDKHPAVGYASSVRIGADKRPVISYYDETNHHLKLLHCGNRSCTSGNTSATVASSSGPLVIGRDGLPLLAYVNGAEGRWRLEVLHCGNRSCTTANTTTTLGDLFGDISLTIGRDGLPLISYVNSGLEVLHCGNRACTSGNSTVSVDNGPHAFRNVAITIGADGLPVLSYLWGSALNVLHCGNRTCSSHNSGYVVDRRSPITMGTSPSLTIGADRLPLVSYVAGRTLKVLHCGNTSCRPHR